MPAPHRSSPAYVRRRDRAVEDDAWIVEFLKRAPVGVMATVENGQPFMNSNLFVYDEARDAIYIHSAKAGRTRANIEQETPPRVCFSIFEMGRLLPASEALEFSVEYAGVSVFGTAHVVEEEAECLDALQQIMDKYAPHLAPGDDYRPPVPVELLRTTVMRMDVESWGAKKKELDDFPGAYWYPFESILRSVRER